MYIIYVCLCEGMSNDVRNVVFLDCETSGVTNGREPACRYYMNGCIEKAVEAAEEAGRDVTAAKLECIEGILRGVLRVTLENKATDGWEKARLEDSFDRILQDFIPTPSAQNVHLKRFVHMGFDQAFSQFWRQTEQIRLLSTDKAYTELYRDTFTKQALEQLSQTIQWKFLRAANGSLHFYYDRAADGEYSRAEGVELVAFDAEEKAHVDAVVRACFGPAVLSICMLEAEVDGAGGGIMIKEDPYYEVFQQHGNYVHSEYAETAHKLSAAEVAGGADIATLYAKMQDIVDRVEGVTFVAHNAVKDKQWIVQSIQNQIRYLQFKDCQRGTLEARGDVTALYTLMQRLRTDSQWFCTQHGDVDVMGQTRSRNGSLAKIMENRGDSLQSVYERVTGRELQGQHDARVDTCACAVIFCRLLMLNHGINVEASGGYARLRGVLDKGDNVCERETKKRPSVQTLLSRIMRLLR